MSRERVVNPAEAFGAEAVPVEQRRRVSMSLPRLKLQIPDGCLMDYHVEWFKGTQDDINAALQGGYEFVTPDEIHLNNVSLAGDVLQSGNTDLGNRVSVAASTSSGMVDQGLRLYLMKLRKEWYEEDQKILAERQLNIANTLVGGRLRGEGSRETQADMGMRYIDKRMAGAPIPDLFKPKPNRRA